jgi:peptidoglycan/LPS O-acetylase OafA/YrhL
MSYNGLLKYRPEIDGLRGISVLLVIFYHFEYKIFNKVIFTGGYIGVDIFFIISGYLITLIILNEKKYSDCFSFKNFYLRRARRILPAFFFFIISALLLGYFFLLTESFIDLGNSGLSSLTFLSNFYYYLTQIEYYTAPTYLRPLLHTWSLSVEFQFYIFFPIIFVITVKIFNRFKIFVLIAGFLFSLFLSNYLVKTHNLINFYMLPPRIFEFLTGSIAAVIVVDKSIKINQKILNFLSIIGVVLIFLMSVILDNKTLHPSIISLPLVVGTFFLIINTEKNYINDLLSKKIINYLGKISFSLYLAHFLLIAFYMNAYNQYPDNIQKLYILILTLLVGHFSYLYIEQPFRNRKIINDKSAIIILFLTFIFGIFLCFIIIKNKGFNSRIHPILQDLANENKTNNEILFNPFSTKKNKEIIILGDSNFDLISMELRKELTSYEVNRKWILMFLDNYTQINRRTKKNEFRDIDNDFEKNYLDAKNTLEKSKNSIVIIGGKYTLYLSEELFNNPEKPRSNIEWGYYFEPKNYKTEDNDERKSLLKKAITKSINDLINKGHPVVLVYPIPELGFDLPLELQSQIRGKNTAEIDYYLKNKNNWITFSYNDYKKRSKEVNDLFDSIVNEKIYRVYPDRILCDTEVKFRCLAHNDKNIFYHDSNHLSKYGARLVTKAIIDKIYKIK